MTQLQKEFLSELKSNPNFTIKQYAELYKKYSKLAIENEENNGAGIHQAKTMGKYYTTNVLSDFIASENKLARIIALEESL